MIELTPLGGKRRAQQERHVLCRVALLEHFSGDARFRDLVKRIATGSSLADLHDAARREVSEMPGGVAFVADGVAAIQGGALEQYLERWNSPGTESLISRLVIRFVDELRLNWLWLPGELTRLMYFVMLRWLGISVDIEYQVWARNGIGRYQNPDQETVRKHVEWFYRKRIKMPADTISAISRESSRDRKTIRDGIKNAEALLGSIPSPSFPHPG